MKRTKLRVISFCMAAVLILGGCGTKAPENKQEDAAQATPAATDAGDSGEGQSDLEPVELTWYIPGVAQTDAEMVFEKANEIIKEKINATVNFNVVSFGDYSDKVSVMLSTGEPLDICFTSDWSNNYVQNVAKGAYLPLDDLLDQYAPKLKASVPEKFWDATRISGQIYGVVNQQISAKTSGPLMPKDYEEKYNFNIKDTKELRDLEPVLEQMKKSENETFIPFLSGVGAASALDRIYAYYGIETIAGKFIPGAINVFNDEVQVVNQFNMDEVKEYFNLMHEWYQKGYIRSDAASYKETGADFKAKNIGVALNTNIKPGGAQEQSLMRGYEIEETAWGKPILSTSGILTTLNAIPQSSKNPERAMMLLELINDPDDTELYNLLVYGIEGTHYNKVSDNRIELTGDSYNFVNSSWALGCVYNGYLAGNAPDDVWEQTRKVNEDAFTSPLIGFSFDATPVNSEIAQCSSVADELLPALMVGAADPETELDSFLDKLNQAGADTIIQEMQRQIDEWLANK